MRESPWFGIATGLAIAGLYQVLKYLAYLVARRTHPNDAENQARFLLIVGIPILLMVSSAIAALIGGY